MNVGAETAAVPQLDQLVSMYLRVLANERAASAHTLRAYERELSSFASYIMERYGKEQVAGAHRASRPECRLAGVHSEIAETPAPGALDRADESRGGQRG